MGNIVMGYRCRALSRSSPLSISSDGRIIIIIIIIQHVVVVMNRAVTLIRIKQPPTSPFVTVGGEIYDNDDSAGEKGDKITPEVIAVTILFT